jgi:hypothetical protein
MIVSSMTGAFRLGAFLDAIFATVFGGRFFGVARFAALLRAGLALAFPRFEAFLRVATRFFALAMAVSCEVCRRRTDFEAIQLSQHYPSVIRRATFIDLRLGPQAHLNANIPGRDFDFLHMLGVTVQGHNGTFVS